MDYWSGRARTNVFLVRFDPGGGYPALGGLEIQSAGAYKLVELPLKRTFSISERTASGLGLIGVLLFLLPPDRFRASSLREMISDTPRYIR